MFLSLCSLVMMRSAVSSSSSVFWSVWCLDFSFGGGRGFLFVRFSLRRLLADEQKDSTSDNARLEKYVKVRIMVTLFVRSSSTGFFSDIYNKKGKLAPSSPSPPLPSPPLPPVANLEPIT